MDKLVVTELIQNELNEQNLQRELEHILNNDGVRSKIIHDYSQLKDLLSAGGNASHNAAKAVIAFLT